MFKTERRARDQLDILPADLFRAVVL